MDTSIVGNALILLGAILMIVNIYRYWGFMKESQPILEQDPKLIPWRNAGLVLLIFFLIGYLLSIVFSAANLILAFVLFFGSVFVAVALRLMMKFVSTSEEMMNEAVDEAYGIDQKTGLYKRSGFCRHATSYLREHPQDSFLIIRWDFDRFKMVNDIYGYKHGDKILSEVGRLSPKFVTEGIVFGHWESDHFAILAPNAQGVVEKTETAIFQMLEEVDSHTHLTFHMGICTIDSPDADIVQVYDHALLALRSIKGNFTERYAQYEPSMRETLIEEHRIVEEMVPALEAGQFNVWYQPQVNYSTGKIIAAEALVRWVHPEKGIISPAEFVPVFEENGFITNLDEYVWNEVCRFQREWIDAGTEPVPISINISRRDIFSGDLLNTLMGLLGRYDLDTSLLHLEITETVYMTNPEELNRIIETFQQAGFRVEMDDFGSGYSSLNTLKNMPIDALKLDMELLQEAKDNKRGGRILSAVVRMANWLDIDLIAEGVEEKEQADFLKSLGCLKLQGFYFSKPISGDEFKAVLSRPDAICKGKPEQSSRLDGAIDFMDSANQATLMFNSFTGVALIASYSNGILEPLRINDRFFSEFNVSQEEFYSKQRDLFDLLYPEDRELLEETLQEAIETEDEASCVIRSRALTEDSHDYQISCRMRLIAKRGDDYNFYFSLQDITVHWEKEELEDKLEMIIENVPSGIILYTLGEESRLEFMSRYACELFKIDPDKDGEYIKDWHFGVSADEIMQLIDTYGSRFNLERTIELRDGSECRIETLVNAVTREDGTIQLYILFLEAVEQIDAKDET